MPRPPLNGRFDIARKHMHVVEIQKYDLKALDKALDRLSGLETASNALDAWRAKGAVNARTS
jgi:hypothetical protein